MSFSQPPVPTAPLSSLRRYGEHVRRVFEGGAFNFLPNWLAGMLDEDGALSVASDLFGFGRAYFIDGPNYFAASNHIGALAFLLEQLPQRDDEAWHLNASFGWFAGDRSPISQVRAIPAATIIDVDRRGIVSQRSVADFAKFYGYRTTGKLDFGEVVDQFQTVARNVDMMTVRVPRVFLSGGQDSRMTAGAWLTSGAAANVVTYGTLPRELEIAEQLLAMLGTRDQLLDRGVTHQVTFPSPAQTTTNLEDRVMGVLARFDGDHASNVVSRDIRPPARSGAVSIGGMGGEILHGYFYQKEGMLETLGDAQQQAERLRRVFGHTATESSVAAKERLIDKEIEHAHSVGQSGPSSLDLFYLREKYRRWPNSRLNGSSILFLGAPKFIRLAFDLTPDQRLDKEVQRGLAGAAAPGWADVPFYKANAADRSHYMERGLTVWQMDREQLEVVLSERKVWPNFYSERRIDRFWSDIESGNPRYAYESWFHRCIIVEMFDEHLKRLQQIIRSSKRLRSLGPARAFWGYEGQ